MRLDSNAPSAPGSSSLRTGADRQADQRCRPPDSTRPPVQAGQRLPFVAPFGREFVAWAPAEARDFETPHWGRHWFTDGDHRRDADQLHPEQNGIR